MTSSCSVTALIPTWNRTNLLGQTLNRILACRPVPDEILIHVDAGDEQTCPQLSYRFQHAVRFLKATSRQGPGGGRNHLVHAARNEILASFDDDSHPLDTDYFARAIALMDQHPAAAVLAAAVTWRGQQPAPDHGPVTPARSYENCGCIMRRSAFLQTHGYLPLEQAYGMEEADLALQLLDKEYTLLQCPELRVFHDASPDRHADAATNAAHIRNTALLAWLRYPRRYWPLGMAQTARRVAYALRQRRFQGIAAGLVSIPKACWNTRSLRRPVRSATIRLSRHLD